MFIKWCCGFLLSSARPARIALAAVAMVAWIPAGHAQSDFSAVLIPDVTIEVVSLIRVDGKTVELQYAISNDSADDFSLIQYGFTYNNASRDAASEGQLYDFKAGKRYSTGWAGRRCVCSDADDHDQSGLLTVAPDARKVYWAQYAAPPKKVTKLSVQFPGAPPIHDVPLEE